MTLTQAEDSRGLYQKYSGISSEDQLGKIVFPLTGSFNPSPPPRFPLLLSSESQHSRLHQKISLLKADRTGSFSLALCCFTYCFSALLYSWNGSPEISQYITSVLAIVLVLTLAVSGLQSLHSPLGGRIIDCCYHRAQKAQMLGVLISREIYQPNIIPLHRGRVTLLTQRNSLLSTGEILNIKYSKGKFIRNI